MEIRFDDSKILEFADKYKVNDLEYEIQDLFRKSKRPFEFITKEQLKLIAYWKSPRIMKHIESNSAEFIKETSAISLSVEEEKLRIGVLTILKGVSYPVASAILHFVHSDRYPIID